MDEHKTSGMTEFLKREIKAWEGAWVGQAYKKRRRNRLWLMIATAAAAVVLIAVCVVVFVPWGNDEPPLQNDGAQNGGGPFTDTAQTETQAESGNESESENENENQTQEEGPTADPYAYDFSSVPEGATPIVPRNTATKNHPVNQTDRVIDIQSIMEAACKIPAAPGQISVLIIHTHTGEGYNRDGALYLDANDEEFARSADGSDGVVAVGAALAKRLNEAGIGTIHCKTVFDGESNRESYSRAADAIEAFRMAYPTLVCVIDVHRAASTDEQGNIVRTLAVQNDRKIAQTQIICGMSAEQTSKTNLALAMQLHAYMNQAFPDSCASVTCKEQTLNQDRAPFSLTLEIGSCGNTLAEALAGAAVTADALCMLFETN
ncbi:MAG: stage II sporulation protein P [Clostridia bacterium]|nr:stage II sporulation protein P [Clostridia bacterium]